MTIATWFAVDWGTTNLRIWAFDENDTVIDHLTSDRGMNVLGPDDFEPALLDLIAPLLGPAPATVICCGMVGAKQGWAEAPYIAVPCNPPDGRAALPVASKDTRLDVRILPGVVQSTPADVMRGEETQIAGYLAQDPEFFGTLCLPGTHTKWAQISACEIVSFRTFMSGELFALLGKQSVLRHGIDTEGWSEPDFLDAVSDAMSTPAQLASRLFGLRADGLVNGLSAQAANARLSGYLIGLELAGTKPYWLGQDIILIGEPDLCGLYSRALAAQSVASRTVLGGDMTLAGLRSAYRTMKMDQT